MANAIYSNALAKARENKMLGQERLYRMAEADSFDEALKILTEVNFGGGDFGVDYDKAIAIEREELFSFVRSDSPNEKFKKFFLLPNDYHNAEAYIKSKHMPIDDKFLTVEDGVFDKENMKNAIMLDKYSSFSKNLQEALIKCDSAFVSGLATGVLVASLIRSALYSDLFELAKKDKILGEIYSVKADYANVSMALRSRDYQFLKDNRVAGGSLSESDLKSLCEDSFDSVKERFKSRLSLLDINLALEAISNGKPLAEFERQAEGFAVKKLKQKRYETSGILPFVSYCYNKLAEIENVRIVLVGKKSNVDSAEIKRRLRENYEG